MSDGTEENGTETVQFSVNLNPQSIVLQSQFKISLLIRRDTFTVQYRNSVFWSNHILKIYTLFFLFFSIRQWNICTIRNYWDQSLS